MNKLFENNTQNTSTLSRPVIQKVVTCKQFCYSVLVIFKVFFNRNYIPLISQN